MHRSLARYGQNRGFSLMEVLACLSILALSIGGILEIYAYVSHAFILNKVYYLGNQEVHNKIEEYHAENFLDIKTGKFSDEPYFFIERTWEIKEIMNGFEVCVSSFSNSGIQLSHKCMVRLSYE